MAHAATFFRLPSANVRFHGVEFADPPQRFGRHRRVVCDMQIVELPPHVCPARRFLNSSTLVKRVEPRVRIRLQPAAEIL